MSDFGAPGPAVDGHAAQSQVAKLHGAELHGGQPHDAELHTAELHGADLHGADLHGADLHGAGLTVGDHDGGVCRRLVRRCRIAASILLIVGAGFLFTVVIAAWDAVAAPMILVAGVLLAGSVILMRRSSLWSAVAASVVPGATVTGAGDVMRAPNPRAQLPGTADVPGSPGSPATNDCAPISGSLEQPMVFTPTAIVGEPRPLSPSLASAPIHRRLGSVVVPIAIAGGSPPGGGALIVHARADGTTLIEGDDVRAWRVGRNGLPAPLAKPTTGPPRRPTGGRFVLVRESDGATFLATTRLTDTW